MDTHQVKAMKVVLLASSLVTLLVLATAAYNENFEGHWRAYQSDYRDLLIASASTESARIAAREFAVEHKQLYLPELAMIDRCTTCHLGVQNPAAADALQPLTAHSGDTLALHPPEKFGCTVCHQGQGRATNQESAHGRLASGEVKPHVDTPLLRGEAVYTSCGRCHDEIDLYGGASDFYASGSGTSEGTVRLVAIQEDSLRRTLPGAERIARGKRLVVQSGCLGCHKYRGRGGTLGPELTYVGDKGKHDFDFSHVAGQHTVEQWLFEHFKLPRAVSPTTDMPDMGLADDEARDLAFYMMSLHRKDAPASHTPHPTGLTTMHDAVRGETLYAMFCSSCHGPDGFGTTMRGGLWPQDADPWGRDWDATDVVVEKRGEMEILVPSLHHPDTLAVVSNEYLYNVISGGRPGTKMLGWADEGGLSADEVTLLVDFVRGWGRPTSDMASVSAAYGDTNVGSALYRANCGACHGTDGEGGIGNSLNSPTFLAVASDAFLRDTIVQGRPNTAMPAWREFDAQELSDLLAHLRTWQPPLSDVASVVSLSAISDSSIVTPGIGRTLYKANCVMCHGDSGEGDLAPSLNTQAFLTVVSNNYLATTLVEGRPGTGMPSWKHLPPEDLASIVQYVRSWQEDPSRDTHWHEQAVPRGDWDAGKALFGGVCSGCHGGDGEGATGPQLNNPVFLSTASDVMLREWISYGKEGTEMRPFRKGGQGVTELSDRQIEDIVAYVRSLERAGETDIVRVAKSPFGRPEKGAELYVHNCAGCHGGAGEGASGPALANGNFLRYASDGFLMATMALGRRGTEMRPVKRGPQSILGLTSDEVNDLVAYLRSWELEPPTSEPVLTRAPVSHRFVVPWDLGNGKQQFESNCAGCHGVDGKGSWAPELNNEGFLAAATDGLLQATIVRGRKGTAMRPFGHGANGLVDMTQKDIDDVVAYIRQWSVSTPSPMTLPAQRSLQQITTDPGIANTTQTEANTRQINEDTSEKRAIGAAGHSMATVSPRPQGE